MEIRKLDSAGLDFVANEEGGYRLKPYLCAAGRPTIGAGCTYYENGQKVKLSDPPITLERAKALLRNIAPIYELTVYSITRDDINQHQFNALVSLCFNIGVTALKGSSMIPMINKDPNDPNIKYKFEAWKYATVKGVKKPILLGRRQREANLYFKVA